MIQNKFKNLLLNTVISGLFVWPSIPASAEPEEQPPSDEQIRALTEVEPLVLEEVIVEGQATPRSIRRQAYQAQDEVFDMFNQLNTDDQFDMVCRKEARIGSQIKYQRCLPRFERELRAEAFQDSGEEGAIYAPEEARIRRLYRQQREVMAQLANEHPEFLALLKKRLALRKELEAVQAENDKG